VDQLNDEGRRWLEDPKHRIHAVWATFADAKFETAFQV
jgi:hypothetical protein